MFEELEEVGKELVRVEEREEVRVDVEDLTEERVEE